MSHGGARYGKHWSRKDDNFLRDNWGAIPASAIGAVIFGTNDKKNAVIGRAHRIGLGDGYRRPLPGDPRRVIYNRTQTEKRREQRKENAQPVVVRAPKPRVVETLPPMLSGEPCCYPLGEPRTKTFRFCDEPVEVPGPYCAKHRKLAYIKVRLRDVGEEG